MADTATVDTTTTAERAEVVAELLASTAPKDTPLESQGDWVADFTKPAEPVEVAAETKSSSKKRVETSSPL